MHPMRLLAGAAGRQPPPQPLPVTLRLPNHHHADALWKHMHQV